MDYELFVGIKLSADNITKCFYGQNDKEGFEKLNFLFGDISILVSQILSDIRLLDNINLIEKELNTLLFQLMRAIEERDTVLLTDTLKYELLEYIDSLYK